MCVKKYPPEIMQPSSSTRATIVSAENQNGATIVKATISFAIITSYGNQITPAKHEDNLEVKVKNPDESQEERAVIQVVQSENICCAFFTAAMLTMVAAATIVRFPPVQNELMSIKPRA